MAQAQAAPKGATTQGHQEGSRWINRRPSGDEVAAWFLHNAPMHDGMKADRYVTGVTLIPAKEKVQEPRVNQAGALVLVDREQLVYVPYVKVETRIAYFWDLMLERGWLGEIEPAPVRPLKTEGYANEHLPPGFFRQPVRLPTEGKTAKVVHFVACSMQVRVYEHDIRTGGKGRLIMAPPAGTKAVELVDRWGKADPNALMKAETGAVGRALGMAGMLAVPGSGVATAEDVQESMGGAANAGVSPDAAELPADAPLPAAAPAQEGAAAGGELADVAVELRQRLESDFPEKADELEAWAREKKIDLNALKDTQLRGVVRQMEKKLAEAQER